MVFLYLAISLLPHFPSLLPPVPPQIALITALGLTFADVSCPSYLLSSSESRIISTRARSSAAFASFMASSLSDTLDSASLSAAMAVASTLWLLLSLALTAVEAWSAA